MRGNTIENKLLCSRLMAYFSTSGVFGHSTLEYFWPFERETKTCMWCSHKQYKRIRSFHQKKEKEKESAKVTASTIIQQDLYQKLEKTTKIQ